MRRLHLLLRSAAAGGLALLFAWVALAATPGAGFAGNWKGTIQGPQGEMGFELHLAQNQGAWQGSITVNDRTIQVQQLKIDGNQISFDTSFGDATIHHTGTLKGDDLNLQISSDQFNTSIDLRREAAAGGGMAAARLPPVRLTADQDHQRMMDLLGIESLRPGADPNHPGSPNAVNYDEAKGNPYPHLPDPLVMNDGRRVTTAAAWWHERRPQIVEAFDEDVYGRVPANTPAVR